MQQTINQVLVVGGGTAGWISAAVLAKKLNSQQADSVQVTLVESPTIPIMGVGEGTWPTIRATLQGLGVDEAEFIRECDATFKQGSEFVNWAYDPEHPEKQAKGSTTKGSGQHSYYHPLSAVFHSAYDFNLAPYWLLDEQEKNNQMPYDLATSTQAHVCKLGLAPKKITTPAYIAMQNYSYHLDAHKFAAFLHKFATEKLGVKYISADVTQVMLDEKGFIEAVQTEQAGRIEADLFIDCSGTKALLIGDALGVPWHSCSESIFNDTALAMQVPYPDADSLIASHTIATAHSYGWTWDIGLSERRGTGFVYSSNHCSDEQAEQSLRAYIGEQSDSLECRKIKFDTGYREKFWHKNCLSMGMSAAFIEPLEASAIFLVEAGVNMLAEQFPRTRHAMEYVAKQYNTIFTLRWDKTVDFIKLHYCISQRRDSDYWIDNCRAETIPDSLQEKLEHWRSHPPSKYDFDYAFEPFVLDSYLFVLYGMQFNADLSNNKSRYTQGKQAQQKFQEIQKSAEILSAELPTQRELIKLVHQYGFSRI